MGLAKVIFGILGNIIASVFYLSPITTFWRITKKRTVEDFSGLPYVGCFASCSLWTFYGLPMVIEGGVLIVTINGAGAGCNLIFILLFLIFSGGKERMKVAALFTVAVVFLGALIAANLEAVPKGNRRKIVGSLGAVANCIMYAAPLSIVKLVIETRSVEFLPILFSVMAFINAATWTAYAAITTDLYIMIPNALGVALGTVNILLYGFYSRATPLQLRDVEKCPDGSLACAEVGATKQQQLKSPDGKTIPQVKC